MSRICALTAATASASGTHPWIGAAPTGQMPGGIAHRQRWSSKRSLSSSLRTMPWTGFHRREARDLPWAVGRREKPFSLEEESGRSHRVPGGTARGGGPTQFQHNQDRPDASGPREHRLQGRLPAGAPVAEGAGAPCPFSRRQGPLPGFYGQALFPPSLALRRYPHPLRMPTDQRLCRGAHERPLCCRGKSLGVPLPPQPPHHAPLQGTSTPAATPRSIPQKPSRNPLFCPLPIPQKEQRGNLTAKGGPER